MLHLNDFRMDRKKPVNNAGMALASTPQKATPHTPIQKVVPTPRLSTNGVRSVALVVDVPNWAFESIAKSIVQYGKKFRYTIVYYDKIKKHDFSTYDIVHFFFYGFYLEFLKYHSKLPHQHFTMGVHGHHHDPREFDCAKPMDAITCVSQRLAKTFSNCKAFYCPDCVDSEVFHPIANAPEHNEIVVGFSGNSQHPINNKGLKDIIEPAVLYSGVKLVLADRNLKWRTPSEMNEWYNSLDMILCASDEEGTPLPILEAAACGKGFISTDVGIVSDFHNGENGIVLPQRSAAHLSEVLTNLTKESCTAMGKAALSAVKLWQRPIAVARYESLWQSLLSRRYIHVIKHQSHHKQFNSIGKFVTRLSQGLVELGLESKVVVAKTIPELESALGRHVLKSDIILFHNWEITPPYQTDVNIVPVFHQLCANSLRHDFYNPIHRQLTKEQSNILQRQPHAILVNPALCRFGQLVYPNTQFHFVPNSINIDTAVVKPKIPQSILWVARLEKAKGFDDFVELARKLRPAYRITIAGDACEKFDMKGLNHIGSVDEKTLYQHYAENQMFVLPSRYESFPNTILEAGIHRCCVIVADLPGFRELFDDAIVYLPDTHPDTMYKIIRSLSTKKCTEYGDKLYRLIRDKYSPKHAALKLQAELDKVFGDS